LWVEWRNRIITVHVDRQVPGGTYTVAAPPDNAWHRYRLYYGPGVFVLAIDGTVRLAAQPEGGLGRFNYAGVFSWCIAEPLGCVAPTMEFDEIVLALRTQV
jgi:hypothetical protein